MSTASIAIPVTRPSAKATASSAAPCVVFAGGGTGGHLFPMLAVAEKLEGCQFSFFGSARPIDRDVIRVADAEFVQQSVRPVSLKPWTWPAFYWHWRRSRFACRMHFLRRRPAVVIGSGGFASGPPMAEAASLGIPTVLLNPDAAPGRANRYLGKRASLVCVQWSDSQGYFPGHPNCRVTGCPVRDQFRSANRGAGIAHFGLRPDRKTLLITGASQGAASINGAITALLDELAAMRDWQILHLAGAKDAERTQSAYAAKGVTAKVVTFTDRMADAMAASDLIVSRAGASTLAEIAALGKPSILMPYPFHRDMHQRHNARMLVSRGAARMVDDRIDPAVTAPALRETLLGLMADSESLALMSAAAQRMAVTNAAETIADEVRRHIAAGRKNGR